MVNTPEVKSVRVARFQAEPPVTRVVIDLSSNYEYELVPGSSKMTVKLTGLPSAGSVAKAAAPATETRPQPVLSASVKPMAVPVPRETHATDPEKLQVAATEESNPKPQLTAAVQPQRKPEQPKAEPVLSASAKTEATPMPKEIRPAETVKQPVTTETRQPSPAERANVAAGTMGSDAPQIMQAAVLATPGPAQNLAAIQQQAGAAVASKPKYTGEPISINVRDVDLKDFFRLINEISGLNIVIDPNVKGSVSMVLNDVPWDQALDIVLRNNNLDRQLDGNVLRIAAVSTLKAEADARRAQIEAQAQAVERQTVTRFLSYSRAAEIAPTVKKFLTPRGEITADARTNSLIISDIPSVIARASRSRSKHA
jgi:type IV pilus assembly protein PilQ